MTWKVQPCAKMVKVFIEKWLGMERWLSETSWFGVLDAGCGVSLTIPTRHDRK